MLQNWVYALKVIFNPTIPARVSNPALLLFFSVRFKAYPNIIEFTSLCLNLMQPSAAAFGYLLSSFPRHMSSPLLVTCKTLV